MQNPKVILNVFKTFLIGLALLCPMLSRALNAGDILFTSYDATGNNTTDAFSFILLVSLPSYTEINFTDRGYNGNFSSQPWVNATFSTEVSIKFTTSQVYLYGTEIKIQGNSATIVGTGAYAGSVQGIQSPTGTPIAGLSLGLQDQIVAYTGTLENSPVLIAGIHWNKCNGTSDGSWDLTSGVDCSFNGLTFGTAGSAIPPGLSQSYSAMWTGQVGSVSPTAGYYNCNGPSILNGPNLLRAAILNKNNWTFSTANPSAINTPAGCNYYTSLPISLVSFDGAVEDGGNLLKWEIADEKDLQKFVIEKSIDAKSFQPLASITPCSNGENCRTYSYVDREVSNLEKVFYRLKMVESEGKFTYSKAISLTGKSSTTPWVISPNPINNNLLVLYGGKSALVSRTITVSRADGKTMKIVKGIYGSNISIDVSELPAGLYIANVSDAISPQVLKFVKR